MLLLTGDLAAVTPGAEIVSRECRVGIHADSRHGLGRRPGIRLDLGLEARSRSGQGPCSEMACPRHSRRKTQKRQRPRRRPRPPPRGRRGSAQTLGALLPKGHNFGPKRNQDETRRNLRRRSCRGRDRTGPGLTFRDRPGRHAPSDQRARQPRPGDPDAPTRATDFFRLAHPGLVAGNGKRFSLPVQEGLYEARLARFTGRFGLGFYICLSPRPRSSGDRATAF